MPHSPRISWIGHLGQPLQQARDILWTDAGIRAQLVKGRRDRG